MHGRSWFRNMSLIVGFSFLYIPIAVSYTHLTLPTILLV